MLYAVTNNDLHKIFQSCPDVSFLLRVLNLGVSAWEMISNQHFTEVALVSLSYLFLVLLILVPRVFLNRLLVFVNITASVTSVVTVSTTRME